jgi:hypothetical protein
MVGPVAVVGELIAFAEGVRMRREREGRSHHARCLAILAASVEAARAALVAAERASERAVWARRLRRLEELHEWAAGAA